MAVLLGETAGQNGGSAGAAVTEHGVDASPGLQMAFQKPVSLRHLGPERVDEDGQGQAAPSGCAGAWD